MRWWYIEAMNDYHRIATVIDYIDRRNELIKEVSLDDIRRVAKRLIEVDRLITTIVGKPVEARPKAAPG